MLPKWIFERRNKFPQQLIETQRDIVVGSFVGATYRQEEIVDSRVRAILREVRIKNYFRNLLWLCGWAWRCIKYFVERPCNKLLAWHSKMYYKWGTKTGEIYDTGVCEGEHGGSSQRRPIEPAGPD
jgi:hypothetical protein